VSALRIIIQDPTVETPRPPVPGASGASVKTIPFRVDLANVVAGRYCP
jgi:hypothetical protein